ncbi:MAG: alpha/beta hydrolase, partial [Fusobacteriia bacterium 4572_132]
MNGIIGSLILIIIITVLMYSGYNFSEKVINIKKKTSKEVFEKELEKNNFDKKIYEKINKEAIKIKSIGGYTLDAIFISGKENEKRTIIISHGVTMSKYSSIKYMNIFLKKGWNVLIYDHRSHGETKGKYVTYGYNEKFDLQNVVKWVKNRIGEDIILGIHGESMGSAIAIQYAGMEDGADFYIFDCSYSDFKEQLTYRLKEEHHLPKYPLIPLVDMFLKIRAGFWLKEIRPLDYVVKIRKPAMFIHAKKDDYILSKMSQELYNAKKGPKRLYLAENGVHAEAYIKNKEK